MGKITVKSIWNDDVKISEIEKWDEAVLTPIVPRKMVEMIIKKCCDSGTLYNGIEDYDYYAGENHAYHQIIQYAELLLKELEGDEL